MTVGEDSCLGSDACSVIYGEGERRRQMLSFAFESEILELESDIISFSDNSTVGTGSW